MAEANPIQKFETLFQQNKKQEALKEYKSFMENAGPKHDLWVNYASFLFRCGQFEEAIAMAQKANSIKPTAEGYHNLACSLSNLGRLGEATDAFKMALHLNYDLIQSHNGLSNIYEQTGQFVMAIDHQQITTTLAPNVIEYWIALARLRRKAGRMREALSALRTARRINPDNTELWITYGQVFYTLNDYDVNKTLIDELTLASKNPNIKPTELSNVLITIFIQQAVVKALRDKIENYRIKNFKTLLQDKTLNWNILNLEIFLYMLMKLTAMGENTETMLTALRYHFLESLDEQTQTLPYLRELLPFLAALSCQCFVNEYIFWEDAAEKRTVDALKSKIETNIKSITAYELAIYAAYRPLHELKNAKEALAKFKSEGALKSLLQMQITEPLEEEEIKTSLKTFTSIDDNISKLVKDQYEVNPYPRWTTTSMSGRRDFRGLMKFLFPYLPDKSFAQVNNTAPEVLIAGCGTGKQSVETSLQVVGANITAIDISAASLAYAVRKTNEFKLTNIDYGIADILKVRELNKKFDIIYCGGVLHHMHDPMEGWRALNDVLKPGGYMMIALYSDVARKSVVVARDYIKDKGFKPDIEGIRACREDIKLMEMHHPVKQVSRWIDFFTASSFRDLVFHVQEHRFTARGLKKAIADLGLEFLGFQFVEQIAMLKKFAALHPDDPHGLNLDYWDDYERQNPDLFVSMYQFWLRKPE